MDTGDFRFEVALSFAGDGKRDKVREVARILRDELGDGRVFFDEWFEAELAGPDAQVVLQHYYGRASRLVVACVCRRYSEKPWTQEEWRAIQSLERGLRDAGSGNLRRMRFFPLRFGDGDVDGLFDTAIVPDVRHRTVREIADLILERLRLTGRDAARQRPPIDERPRLIDRALSLARCDRGLLRSALTLGWELARYELIDESAFPEAEAAAQESREEINEIIEREGLVRSTPDTRAKPLMRRIIRTYSAVSPERHAAVLIGISAMRVTLVGASRNEQHNDEMLELARSAVADIDPALLPTSQRQAFFDALLKARPATIVQLLEFMDRTAM